MQRRVQVYDRGNNQRHLGSIPRPPVNPRQRIVEMVKVGEFNSMLYPLHGDTALTAPVKRMEFEVIDRSEDGWQIDRVFTTHEPLDSLMDLRGWKFPGQDLHPYRRYC